MKTFNTEYKAIANATLFNAYLDDKSSAGIEEVKRFVRELIQAWTALDMFSTYAPEDTANAFNTVKEVVNEMYKLIEHDSVLDQWYEEFTITEHNEITKAIKA